MSLPDTGVYVYAEHPTTDIWCMAWAFDDEEPEIWIPPDRSKPRICWACGAPAYSTCDDCGKLQGADLPLWVATHIANGGAMRAHNAQFERIMWREVMVKKYGAPAIADENWYCSAAEAAAMSLPRSLGQLAEALRLPAEFQKDSEGHNLMMRMCRPRKIHDDGTIVWWDVEERLQRLYAYCKQDVRAEQAVSRCLRPLDETERKVYLLDQKTNDRGVLVDRPLVVAAQGIADEGIRRANLELNALTSGDVPKVSNHTRLRRWLNENGCDTASTDKEHVAALLESDLEPLVRKVLLIRESAGLSSLAKLKSMLLCASTVDDRARGMLLYHGAVPTGRWAGRLIQPQNFPRGTVDDVEQYLGYILSGSYDTIGLFEQPLAVVSSSLRAMLRAAPGHDLLAADYSAIEARVCLWLAGQHDKLELFRRYDNAPKDEKHKFDPYRHNAANLYKIALDDVKKFPHRQTGKFQELGCQFGMGAKKAVTAGKKTYGLTLTEDEAKAIVDNYRMTHSRVVDFWYEAERACIEAITTPGITVPFGDQNRLKVKVAGAYMYIRLPSGRKMAYPAPRVVDAETPWGEMKPTVEVHGVDSNTGEWCRQRLYGGIIVENIVQAVARDLMAAGMLRAEDVGYAVVLSVHDEVVVEVPKGFGSVEDFEYCLSDPPAWAADCPISAEGWRGERYRK